MLKFPILNKHISKIDFFLECERYLNDGSPSGFTVDKSIDSKYSPFSDNIYFSLPIYSIDALKCTHIGYLENSWSKDILTRNRIPIPLHPAIKKNILNSIDKKLISFEKEIKVIATSSGRTVFVNDVKPHFIKLHYPKKIGRFIRDLPLYKWISSLENSQELSCHSLNLPSYLGFMPEYSGSFLQNSINGFGVLYRDFNVFPVFKEKSCYLIPIFSLFSKKREIPLIIDLVGNDFNTLLYNILIPLIKSYIYMSCELGMIPEFNAQNTLLEIFENGNSRIVIRDMADFFKDITVRENKKLHTSFCSYHSIRKDIDSDFFQRRSFAYDFKCSHYILKPLIEAFSKYYNYNSEELFSFVKDVARDLWGPYVNYFNNDNNWYSYPKKKNVTRESYVVNQNPLFR